ncbi:formate dehydrogenase-specific chaperone [Campylobacter sp. TTU-622]|uniref:TorD/DmsD family molecular chaperone n=1 Tax=unclassified Campylobacter TaxID=2593542 RepID=UPI001904CF6F|nr:MULTISPECIES: formate dehydrogenase-specific chaperone [unclassified Campylobacter]MBK1972210.1 formate dehydrogenase-specific chaperone [Campylobacter sp. TTU_617]MBK1972925.1 formate dehydrogenase-specific chaperone [Campylobacter sp. TTU-622]MBK1991891.1 formate dehydrogenase-specific chaperone [Campylobacter sp. 2018MI34]
MQEQIQITRKYFYEFFSLAFDFIDEEKFNIFITQAKFLSQIPLEDKLTKDFEIILTYDLKTFLQEQNAVFFDFSYVNVPTTASFYDEGRDDGRKKLQACAILRKSPYRKDEKSSQSEDEFGFIFALMPYLIDFDKELAKEFFEKILNSVIDEFIEKLKIHKNSNFFIHFGNIMEVFFKFERSILNLEKPKKTTSKSIADIALERLPYESKLPTQFSKINIDELSKL